MSASKAESLLNAAQEAAWNGNHDQAIALCTEALTEEGLDAATRIDLFAARAESFFALHQLELAAKDAESMLPIAERENEPAFQARALNRQTIVQIRRGADAAVPIAAKALQFARLSGRKEIEAQSLYILSEAQLWSGLRDESIFHAWESAELYRNLHDASGEGRAMRMIAASYWFKGDNEEVRRFVSEAIVLCRRSGDQYGLGNALHLLSFVEIDLAKRIQLNREARQAFISAGYLERRIATDSSQAITYSLLGLLSRARRILLAVEESSRQFMEFSSRTYQLENLAQIEIALGNLENARRWTAEMQKLDLLGEPKELRKWIQILLGQIALLENRPADAAKFLNEALQAVEKEGGSVTDEIRANVFLGQAYLAIGDLAAALQATTRSADIHGAHSLAVLNAFPRQHIWWTHSQVLRANKRFAEAWEALIQSYQLVLEHINGMSDEGLRRNYLNKIKINREIIDSWLREGQERQLPAGELYAHLEGKADLREPFQRLVDTGLRLNALNSEVELHEFLIDEATEIIGAERVLLILDNENGRLLAGAQMPPGEEAQLLLDSIAGLLEHVRKTRSVALESAESPRSPTPSRISAPLIAQNKILGYLYADMDARYGSFDQTDADMLGMLAAQGAVALANARLLDGLEEEVRQRTAELNARVDELQIINSVQQGLATEMDFQAIVDLVGDKLRKVFDTPDFIISWYDERDNLMHYLYFYEHGQRLEIPSQPPAAGGIFDTMVQTRQPIVLNNADDFAQINIPLLPGKQRSKSMLSVPIISADRVLGLMGMENFERENAYGDAELRLMTTIAASLGTALENARLFDETQHLLRETERREAEKAALEEVGRQISATLDLEIVLERIAGHARKLLNADASALYLRDKDRPSLFKAIAAVGEDAQEIKAAEFSSGEGILGDVARRRSAEMINFTADDPRTLKIAGTDSRPFEHMLVTPLLSPDGLRGLMAVWRSGQDRAFKLEELNFLSGLSLHAV
ncbi:MAG: GAF domain-containing protein, partial [Candidatus Promineifilaceae bacterium]|nr:GAF domain-containing protein [Candidatus Promineifilaceae bacterium]